MASIQILPHRTAAPSSVDWGRWWVQVGELSRKPADELVTNWDYSTPITFQLQPAIDEAHFLTSTGLPALRVCDVVVTAECLSTGRRFLAQQNLATLAGTSEKLVQVSPPPSELAGDLKLRAHIVLVENMLSSGDRVATRFGARLATLSPTTVSLEGSGARFPTEAVSFASLGLEAALWTLRVDASEPDEPFTSVVRLFINTDHPASSALIDRHEISGPLLVSALETDVIRQIFEEAHSMKDIFVDRLTWSEGSFGETLENLGYTFFDRPFTEISGLMETDRPAFERILQDRSRLFREIR
ncbi:hypothetical protein BJF86_09555 [Serinicoccus sp. CNJ-927]|uniref:hypothetical protein n=1 Tax=Serinicoccus sp. CNJ-927 TaxID=1904970 RepID=UPI00096955AE|nr:hypothetical protein [Serinicoccus sp. CNJ-927]OLT39248.1 hypothetical protein BJF86_09555 [Serinicoccus sp. CNJ-927]